jgi:GTP-binding protein HflX
MYYDVLPALHYPPLLIVVPVEQAAKKRSSKDLSKFAKVALMLKIIIADIVPKEYSKPDADKHFAELIRLIETLGGMTIVKVIQKRGRPSGKTYLGTGKAEEIGQTAKELKADAVVINGILKGNQIFELTQRIPVVVWDRVDVILRIFEKHAKTAEARLQIRRAQLEYDIPKIYGRAATTLFERERGGISANRGAGERGIELEKRHILKQIKQIDQKIAKLQKSRENQRKHRERLDFQTVALVGYTNSGKSTLLQALTQKKVYIADELFATLDPRIGDWYLPKLQKKVLLADTIGFIENLPPVLIASFLATLEEVKEADLLLCVYDASENTKEQRRKIKTINQTLKELKVADKPQILVANKIDLISPQEQQKLKIKPELVPVSASNKINFDLLKTEVANKLIS